MNKITGARACALASVRLCVWVWVYMRELERERERESMCACARAHVRACMCTCMHARTHARVYVCVLARARACVCVCVCVRARARVCDNVRKYIRCECVWGFVNYVSSRSLACTLSMTCTTPLQASTLRVRTDAHCTVVATRWWKGNCNTQKTDAETRSLLTSVTCGGGISRSR